MFFVLYIESIYTRTMTSQALDLPLLRAFVAIYETGSVTAAAERLFLTQPTVSYALARLRDVLNDRLFVRQGSGMTPTARARDCYERFSRALLQIEDAVTQSGQFIPAASTRRFRIAMSDIGELVFLPPLMALLQQRAPGVEVEVIQTAVEEQPGRLASGTLDATIGHFPGIFSQTHHTLLFREHYVCLASARHPSIGKRITMEAFASARHASVTSKFSGHEQVEEVLRERGVMRKIALQIPHFTILPKLISSSDLLVVVPSRVATLFEAYGGVKSYALPIAIPSIEVHVHWDRRHESGVAQQWFVSVVREALEKL